MAKADALKPELSIVIAAFNAAATIGDQLSAIERQDVPFAFEVLVCDNGSTDATSETASRWVGRIPGMRLIDASARRGPGAARNIGVAQARGKLIAFCDADDVVGETWLAELHAALQRAYFVAARIEHRRLNSLFSTSLREAEGITFIIPSLPQYPMVGAGHMGVHKSAFEEVGGFDESMRTAEDLDLSWRLQLAGHALVEAPDAVVHVRYRETLLGIYKQAYDDGSAQRQLHHKYAHIFEYHGATEMRRVDGGGGVSRADRIAEVGKRALRIPYKVVRVVRSPLELAPNVRRLGFALGKRRGHLDEGAPQLLP